MFMKNFLLIIFLLAFLSFGTMVLAVTNSAGSSVNISAKIESGGVPPPPPVTVKTLQITPPLGNVVSNCGQVTITWKTEYYTTVSGVTTISDASASTEVGYGITADNENIITGAAGVNHSVTISGLTVGLTYKYYVLSSDGTLTKKNSGTFMATCGISNPTISVLAKNKGAEISLNYPAGADVARLVIRRSTQSAPANMGAGDGIYDGAPVAVYNDPNIGLGVTYWYTIFICNSANTCSQGTFGSASRLAYGVSGIQANAVNQAVALLWNNPPNNSVHDFIFLATRVVRVNVNCQSAGINDGAVLGEGNFTGYEDTGLENGQTYNYKIFTRNGYGEYSAGSCVSATPSAGAGVQCISNISVLSGNNWASVGWNNPPNVPNVFQFNGVQWQRANSCVNSISNGQTVYNGSDQSFYDGNVVNDNTYAYTAFVRYNQNNIINCGCVAATPKGGILPGPVPGAPGAGGQVIIEQNPNFNFYVNNGILQIFANEARELFILPSHDLTINIRRDKLPKPVSLLVAQIGDKNYFISLDSAQNKYQTSFIVPAAPGDYDLLISTVYFDQAVSNQLWKLKVLPWGYVSLDRKGVERIPEVRVILRRDGADFNGFGVKNPQLTDANGFFGFMVPNDVYDLEITKIGYKPYLRRNLKIQNNIINLHIDVAKDQNILKTTIEILNNPEKIAENISDIARQAVLENPAVEKVTVNYVAPTVATVVSISTVMAIPWWNLIYYLQYLFTEPFIWLFRRRRKGWGVVYNSITKKPIDLAVVRLYDQKTKKLLQSKITDKDGRYNFMIDEGEYYIEVTKPNFVFPSVVLMNIKEDKKYVDLYHGQNITIKEGQAGVIIANIPLDQEDVYVSDRQILRKYFWHKIRKNISVAGPIFSTVLFIIYPNWLMAGFVLVHTLMYWLFRRLAEQKKAKAWGMVYDRDSKQLLGKAVARIYSSEYNKMLEVQITDKHGRYGFLAGDNINYLAAIKDGNKDYKSENIDLRGKKTDEVVGQDIALERHGERPMIKRGESGRRIITAGEPLGPRVEVGPRVEEGGKPITPSPSGRGQGEGGTGKKEGEFNPPHPTLSSIEEREIQKKEPSPLEEVAEKLVPNPDWGLKEKFEEQETTTPAPKDAAIGPVAQEAARGENKSPDDA